MAHKLIEAAKGARRVSRCDHDIMPMPDHLSPSGFSRTFCKKCGASFYEPIPNGENTNG
jgi:hypothetical protein